MARYEERYASTKRRRERDGDPQEGRDVEWLTEPPIALEQLHRPRGPGGVEVRAQGELMLQALGAIRATGSRRPE